MKVIGLLWRGLVRSFSYTTLYAFIIYIMTAISDPERNAIVVSQYLLLALFGLFCGYAQELFLLRRLPLIARVGIHYGTVTIPFLLTCVLSGKIELNFGKIVIFAIIFSLVYAVVVAAVLGILRATGIYQTKLSYSTEEKEEAEKEYTNRF